MEIIYILTNTAMPGYIKIGKTTDLNQRLKSLDNTSSPLPFECFYACTVNDAAFVERQLHDAFKEQRVRSSREFFELSPERAVSALKLAEIEDVTPREDIVETAEDQQALNKARTRRSRFNFKLAEVPVGAELTFVRNPEITALVMNDREVSFKSETMSLSAAAQNALEVNHPVQGPAYWIYEDETLDERRLRLE